MFFHLLQKPLQCIDGFSHETQPLLKPRNAFWKLGSQVPAGPEIAVPKPTIVPNSATISSRLFCRRHDLGLLIGRCHVQHCNDICLLTIHLPFKPSYKILSLFAILHIT